MAKNSDKSGKTYRDYAKVRFNALKDIISQIPTEEATKEVDLLRELEAAATTQEMIDQVAAFVSS